MVYQEEFGVERWMDKYEHKVDLNISETCCDSITLGELAQLSDSHPPFDKVLNTKLTYGPIPGSDELRNIVAEIHNDSSKGSIMVGKDNVVLANGAISANFIVWYSLVGPEDHVICVNPVYQQLKSVPKMFGADVSLLNLKKENNFLPDLDELRALVKKGKTKMIVINNPHNSTGTVIPQGMMLEIVEIARAADIYLMCDEVYRPLYHSLPAGDEAPSSVCTLYSKGISTCSTSKAFSMAGLRVGWIVSSDSKAMAAFISKRDYSMISISQVDDALACWALTNRKYVLERSEDICLQGLALFDAFIGASHGAVSWVRPVGGSVLLLFIKGICDTETFCANVAAKKSLLLVPGECFDTPGAVRIGFGTEPRLLRAGLERLAEYLQENQGATFGPW
jgi:aspartate/methionine/tyrosine aminotransferase